MSLSIISWGNWGAVLAFETLAVLGLLGLAASRYFRDVNLLMLRWWPWSRRFRRYLRLGNQLKGEMDRLRRQ